MFQVCWGLLGVGALGAQEAGQGDSVWPRTGGWRWRCEALPPLIHETERTSATLPFRGQADGPDAPPPARAAEPVPAAGRASDLALELVYIAVADSAPRKRTHMMGHIRVRSALSLSHPGFEMTHPEGRTVFQKQAVYWITAHGSNVTASGSATEIVPSSDTQTISPLCSWTPGRTNSASKSTSRMFTSLTS